MWLYDAAKSATVNASEMAKSATANASEMAKSATANTSIGSISELAKSATNVVQTKAASIAEGARNVIIDGLAYNQMTPVDEVCRRSQSIYLSLRSCD